MNRWKERQSQICTSCKDLKSLDSFYKRSKNSHLYKSRCIECTKKYDKIQKQKRELTYEIRKKWYENRKAKYPEIRRDDHYRRKYDISLQDYNKMLETQLGLCAICQNEIRSEKQRLVVDHCHKTKKIRKLLCNNCNWAIGLFDENPEFLDNAIQYLIEFG